MNGLVSEANDIINEKEDNTITRDAPLIMTSQKVEHYEIATYGETVQLAKTLDKNDAAGITAQTLQKE